MSLPRYPKYKHSGVGWLGDVPEHWDVVPLKRIVHLRSGDATSADDIADTGDYPVYGGNGLRGYSSAYTHEGEFVLIGRQGALCGNVNYASGRFWASEHAVVASPIRPVSTRWLGEMLRTMNLNQHSVSAAQPGLSVDLVANLRTVLAPLDEQVTIGAFLDREISKIDALVLEQRRLVELLKEKRQAVISHAVTKGLNPEVSMRPSGIEWLGDPPEHWTLPPLYLRYEVVLGKMLDTNRIVGDHLLPYLRNVDVQWGRVNVTDLPLMDVAPSEMQRFTLAKGDVLVCEGGEVGRTAIWNGEIETCAFQKAIHRLRPLRASEDPRFFYYCMQFAARTGVFVAHGNPNTIPHLTGEQFRLYRFPTPPKDEQVAIAAFLDRETARLDALSCECIRTIELMQERRAALISAAVTGQIDVRSTAVEQPT